MMQPKMERMSDEHLCELAGEDSDAQNCLFERHIDSVTRFLMRNYQGIEHEAVAAEKRPHCICATGGSGGCTNGIGRTACARRNGAAKKLQRCQDWRQSQGLAI